jgi:hypothetical protein
MATASANRQYAWNTSELLKMENLPDAKKFSFFSKNSGPLLKTSEYEATMNSFSIPFEVDAETFGRISKGRGHEIWIQEINFDCLTAWLS